MSDREDIRSRMSQDGIEFLLAQFVDMHGSAKVKMVPVSCFDAMLDEGAGFAGAAVWGMGQGPHAHDMMARIDLDSYTPLPWMPNTARFAADLFVDGESHPSRALCAVSSPTVNCYKRLQLGSGLYSSRSGFTWTPAFVSYGDNNRTQMIRTAGPGHSKIAPSRPAAIRTWHWRPT